MNQNLLALASSIVLVCGAAACLPSVPLANEAADTGALERDVKVATERMKDLADKLDEGQKKLGAQTFPDDLAMVIGAINVPFDASNLEGKRVGRLPNRVLRSLLAFTSGAEGLNRSKDKL